MNDEQFTVDGTLIQAWASQKSFQSKNGSDNGDGPNFHGQRRSNKTHESTTDADARLYKKSYGKESKLSYLVHALVENRNGLIAAAMVTHADGYAINLSRRWLVEKGFEWLKQLSSLRQVKLRGLEKVDWLFVFNCTAHNLIRLPRLMAQPPEMLRKKCA